MKLVTLDYGCGTSSSILDYGIEDVVVISEKNYEHIFEIEDNLLFIGHDFLFFLWDTEEKLKKWNLRKDKWEHWVWCFERIDAIVPAWMKKSHYSLTLANTFCNRIIACDEDDCNKYGFDWLPQWASIKFFAKRDVEPTRKEMLFSGQAGKPEYKTRTDLINNILSDESTSDMLHVSNISRDLGWDAYIENFLEHSMVLNPVGVLKALNTRAYETLYSNRILLQQTIGKYERHEKLLGNLSNVVFFENFEQLKYKLEEKKERAFEDEAYYSHNIFSRMKSIGLDVK